MDYIDKTSKILDIGSGDGSFARAINRHDVYMFDGNANTIKMLEKEFSNVKHGKIPILPYENSFFDLIHTSHLIEHLQVDELYNMLKEIDRCLKVGGHLVISAPLLWSEFYDDMSHFKPYNPKLFEKYLNWGVECCCTRPLISNKYRILRKVYRYNMLPYDDMNVFVYSDLVDRLIHGWKKLIYNLGIRKLEKSGYTIVFKKEA
jgi:ubiquinone/menaquinone biosynthesis C-methylase UbiE